MRVGNFFPKTKSFSNVVAQQKIAKNFLDERRDKRMNVRTAKGQENTSGKNEVVKDGILRSCYKEVQQP